MALGATEACFLRRDEVSDVDGAVVAIDVLRAFTTAAYAFGDDTVVPMRAGMTIAWRIAG